MLWCVAMTLLGRPCIRRAKWLLLSDGTYKAPVCNHHLPEFPLPRWVESIVAIDVTGKKPIDRGRLN